MKREREQKQSQYADRILNHIAITFNKTIAGRESMHQRFRAIFLKTLD